MQISAQKNARWKLCLLVGKVTKKVCSRCGSVALNMPLGPPYQEKKKEIYWHITFNACASNFCEPNFQEFRLK